MHKRKKNKEVSHSSLYIKTLYLTILGIVFLISVFMALFSKPVQFSPELNQGMPIEQARELVSDLGPEGISWYCGYSETFTDFRGNTYGSTERQELKRILGNDFQLSAEFC